MKISTKKDRWSWTIINKSDGLRRKSGRIPLWKYLTLWVTLRNHIASWFQLDHRSGSPCSQHLPWWYNGRMSTCHGTCREIEEKMGNNREREVVHRWWSTTNWRFFSHTGITERYVTNILRKWVVHTINIDMAVCQNLVPLVNIK